jgi:glutathione S-transferase
MADLILYTNPQSRGRIAHWMMEELGEPFETVWLDYGPAMKAPEYLAVNPMGKVPTLRHGEVVVTESAAICAYLADRFPGKGLIPPAADPRRAAWFRWMFFVAGPLEMALTARSLDWKVPPDGGSRMVGFGSYADTLRGLNIALTPGPFVCGAQFTAADVVVGSAIIWGMVFGTIEKRPAFEAYAQRCMARPAYQRSVSVNDAIVQAGAA